MPDFPTPPEVCTARRAAYVVDGERPVTAPVRDGASPVKDQGGDLEKVERVESVPYSIHAVAGTSGPPTVAEPFTVAETVWPSALMLSRFTVGTSVWVPVPVTGIACGLPATLSVMVNVVLVEPTVAGEKLTWKIHKFELKRVPIFWQLYGWTENEPEPSVIELAV
jgi:hypothetical protein